VIRITIVCPEAHIGDANQLAMVLGEGPAEALTYGAPTVQDGEGNRYAVASLPVSPAFLSAAQSPLSRPAWDGEPYTVNMAGAARAQALIVLYDPGTDPEAPAQVPAAAPDIILTLPGDPATMLDAAGVVRIPEDDDG
jgi:hypothetical protein